MSLALVEVKLDGPKGFVTLQSDNDNGALAIQELQHAGARTLAIKEAAKAGMADPRTEMTSSPYAVDETGAVVGDPRKQIPAAYRVDVPVIQRLV
jgi:hypothetical protein